MKPLFDKHGEYKIYYFQNNVNFNVLYHADEKKHFLY